MRLLKEPAAVDPKELLYRIPKTALLSLKKYRT
jgi:hypothetical protein